MTEPGLPRPNAARVALLMPNFEAGGAERVMIRLAGGLAERGYRVDLIVLSERGAYRDEVDPRVTIVGLNAARAWRGMAALARYLRQNRPAALLSALFHMNFLAVMARRLAGISTRVVISEHNTQELVRRAVSRPRWWLYRLAQRLTYPLADAAVAVSAGIADDLARAVPALRGRISAIGNPVVTPELLEQSRQPLAHDWLAPDAPALVLAAGRLIQAKGFDVLLEAFAQVLARVPARLAILGEGPERAALQERIAQRGLDSRVLLAGFAKNPYAWMRRARVFVLSSRHEGLPGALIEAMACGCRVVATDCPHGPAEILEHGRWGQLVAVDDAAALAQAICAALTADQAPDVARRALDYSLPQAVQAYAQVLRLPPR